MSESLVLTPISEEIVEIPIEQDNKKYLLKIKIKEETMTFIISQPEEPEILCYSRKMSLEEIRETNKLLYGLNSCNEFADYLKELSKLKKLSIKENEDKLSFNFVIEYLLKNHIIEINLFPNKTNLDITVNKDLLNEMRLIKQKIKILEKENANLKEEIKEIKKILEPINNKSKESLVINKNIFNNNSVIMKEKEFDMIKMAIKSRMNKEVKEIKKLYQATIDGDGPINFHSRCDNIPNTLTIIKSAGNRRFGGFTSQVWDSSSGNYKDDKNAFLFSLDKQKIYSYKNNGKAIFCYKDYGPTFGCCHDIYIGKYAIQEKKLSTYESNSNGSYNFYGDKNGLSESGNATYIYAVEYEVFQIIF